MRFEQQLAARLPSFAAFDLLLREAIPEAGLDLVSAEALLSRYLPTLLSTVDSGGETQPCEEDRGEERARKERREEENRKSKRRATNTAVYGKNGRMGEIAEGCGG